MNRYEVWCYSCGKMWFTDDPPDVCPHCHEETVKYEDTWEDKIED